MVETGTAAVDAIRSLAPDLVFLDVQMPGKTGIEVVREIGVDAMPATIFVTAFDKFAIQAFEMAAVDYLVKPFDDDRFAQTLERARRMIELKQIGALRDQLLAVLGGSHPSAPPTAAPPPSGYLERFAVEMRGKVRIVPVSDVDYIVASGPYAELHVGDRMHLIREPMQTLEERLDPAKFMRVHRSIIVRLDLVDTLRKGAGGDYEVQLKTGARLRVSRSRREDLERRLGVTPKVRSA
jgi:two-component system LytT family response regulator